jgi:hypothetical protein
MVALREEALVLIMLANVRRRQAHKFKVITNKYFLPGSRTYSRMLRKKCAATDQRFITPSR